MLLLLRICVIVAVGIAVILCNQGHLVFPVCPQQANWCSLSLSWLIDAILILYPPAYVDSM